MREQYIKMRNEHRVDPSLLYTFAREQGFNGDPTMFMTAMQFTDINEMLSVIDQKFKLTLLFDKNNKFIKVVE